NAELNGLKNCHTYEDDALQLGSRYGKFDLVSWNLPFIFLPEEKRFESIDGFGGEMGIGLCLEFVKVLPELLQPNGVACVAALAPILQNGDKVLEKRLKEHLSRLGLDCTILVTQISLADTRELWHFHQGFGIRKFESVYLCFRHGHGALRRTEPPASRK